VIGLAAVARIAVAIVATRVLAVFHTRSPAVARLLRRTLVLDTFAIGAMSLGITSGIALTRVRTLGLALIDFAGTEGREVWTAVVGFDSHVASRIVVHSALANLAAKVKTPGFTTGPLTLVLLLASRDRLAVANAIFRCVAAVATLTAEPVAAVAALAFRVGATASTVRQGRAHIRRDVGPGKFRR